MFFVGLFLHNYFGVRVPQEICVIPVRCHSSHLFTSTLLHRVQGRYSSLFSEFEATLLPILFCHRQYQSTEMCVRLHSNYTTRVAENTVRSVYFSHAPP
jgi:hypothetical protein